jgi:hypothetical protein
MPETSFIKKNTDAPLFRQFPRYAGAAVALFGLLIIASWYAHWQAIIQMLRVAVKLFHHPATASSGNKYAGYVAPERSLNPFVLGSTNMPALRALKIRQIVKK